MMLLSISKSIGWKFLIVFAYDSAPAHLLTISAAVDGSQ